MYIHTRLPPTDQEKLEDLRSRGWVRLREPGNVYTAILVSLPLMACTGAVTVAIFLLFSAFPLQGAGYTGESFSFSFSFDLPLVIGILAVLVGHELLHLLLVPDMLHSKKTGVGITALGGFTYTEEVLSRSRHLLISAAPFAVISLILPFLIGIAGLLSPAFFIPILLNSLGSSVDILTMILVLVQVPKEAMLVSNGGVTCWKGGEEAVVPG